MDHGLATHLLAFVEPLKQTDLKLAGLLEQRSDAAIFKSLSGAGEALARRLSGAFGSDRQRLSEAGDIQCLSGIALVMVQSGKTRHIGREAAAAA